MASYGADIVSEILKAHTVTKYRTTLDGDVAHLTRPTLGRGRLKALTAPSFATSKRSVLLVESSCRHFCVLRRSRHKTVRRRAMVHFRRDALGLVRSSRDTLGREIHTSGTNRGVTKVTVRHRSLATAGRTWLSGNREGRHHVTQRRTGRGRVAPGREVPSNATHCVRVTRRRSYPVANNRVTPRRSVGMTRRRQARRRHTAASRASRLHSIPSPTTRTHTPARKAGAWRCRSSSRWRRVRSALQCRGWAA